MAEDNPDGFLLMYVTRAETSVIEEYSNRQAAKEHKRAIESEGGTYSDGCVIRPITFSDKPVKTADEYTYRGVYEHLIDPEPKRRNISQVMDTFDDVIEWLVNRAGDKVTRDHVLRYDKRGNVEYIEVPAPMKKPDESDKNFGEVRDITRI